MGTMGVEREGERADAEQHLSDEQDAPAIERVGQLPEPNGGDEERYQLREPEEADHVRLPGDLVRLEAHRHDGELAAEQRHDLPGEVAAELRRPLQWRHVGEDRHVATLRTIHRPAKSLVAAGRRSRSSPGRGRNMAPRDGVRARGVLGRRGGHPPALLHQP